MKKLNVKIIVPIILVAIVVVVGIIFINENKKNNELKEISYNELIEKLGIVEEIEINKENNTAKVKYKEESVTIPNVNAFIEYTKENCNNIKIKIKK